MTTLASAPLKGEDGKYQIRIESYDPARNTMKAIWLVSRNQRLLSQLLDKCEVSNDETTNDALRGNLLSVQKELQQLRDTMDHQDGAQTPVLDTSVLGLGNSLEENDAMLSSWGESSIASASVAEDEFQAERASSAFGFGSKRRSVLSQIPKYSRPSIRTDFAVSKYEPFPTIRNRPSKIPKSPPSPKKKGKKSGKTTPKTLPRSKTSLSGRGSQMSNYGRESRSGRTSILKTSSLKVRPATSMALTRSVTKKVSFGDPMIDEKPKTCHSKTTSLERKKKTIPKRSTDVRPATSLGIRSIPRSSSRLSGVGTGSARTSSGRQSVDETPAKVGRVPRRSASANGSDLCRSPSTKTGGSTKKTKPQTNPVKKPVGKVRGIKTVQASVKNTQKAGAGPKRPIRPKSASEMQVRVRPEVLPFESPPPVPKIHSQPCPGNLASHADKARDDSASPVIRGISIIDDDSENDDLLNDIKRSLPRIRIGDGDHPEYKVKAYFLDDMDDLQPAPQLNSGVIPSSPVEVDAASARDSEPPVEDMAAGSPNNTPSTFTPEVKQEPTECNNTDGVEIETIKNKGSEKEPMVWDKDSASVEATGRDHHDVISPMPELGMDYLPEFEDEVNSLLDTLMSQDLLTSSFSQDFRLFSTESNYLDTLVDTSGTQDNPLQHEDQQDTLHIPDKIKARPVDDEDYRDIVGSLNPTSQVWPEATITPMVEAETSPVEEMNKDPHHEEVMKVVQGANEQTVSVGKESETYDVEQSNNAAVLEDTSLATVDIPQRKLCISDEQEPEVEFISASEGDSPPAENTYAPSLSLNCGVASAIDEIQPHKRLIGDALRRKSTGSYDATALSMSIAAALKPRSHRRSASQTELDAMLTNNDGYDQRTMSPGISKRGLQQQGWSGNGVVSTADLCSFAETCSMCSSSELTVPDPSETYHDVHHGYSPSFAAMTSDPCGGFRKMALNSPSPSPTAVRQASFHRASFDFLSGNRAHLMETHIDMHNFHPQTDSPSFLRYESESTMRLMSTNGAEELDEIEECCSPDTRPTVSKDRFLKAKSSYSTWEENQIKENTRRSTHTSEDVSEGEDSVIHATISIDTDEDTVEDAQASSSADGSMDITKKTEKPSTEIDSFTFACPAHIHKDSADMPAHVRKDSAGVPAHVRKDSAGVPTTRTQKKKWSARCGFLRFLKCSTTLEKTDRA